jgi:hypothetical protein
MGSDLDLPDEVYGFGSWLLWVLATRATTVVDRAFAVGPARPSRHYGMVDGHPVPTPSLVAWLLVAAEAGLPPDGLVQRDRRLDERQKVLRTIVSRAISGESRLFKESWLRDLAAVCRLGQPELDLLYRSRGEEGHPVYPDALRTAIARTLRTRPADGGRLASEAVTRSDSAPFTSASGTGGSSDQGHAFISYVREDSGEADTLQRTLEGAGIRVWRDTADLWPGENWRVKIRDAIIHDALVFIACFSSHSAARRTSYANEELMLAIEQLRLRQPDDPWLIPVRFDNCDVPDLELGAGRTLASIQWADLFGPSRDLATRRLVTAVQRLLQQPAPSAAEPSLPLRWLRAAIAGCVRHAAQPVLQGSAIRAPIRYFY